MEGKAPAVMGITCRHRLSVIIIGRDDANSLLRCIHAVVHNLKLSREQYEIVYVDSESSDQSVTVAAPYADLIVTLTGSEILSASAGRHHGFRVSHAPWVLHLDSDMVLTPEFGRYIPDFIHEDHSGAGCVGFMSEVYEDGSVLHNAKRYRRGLDYASNIGGAVLLPRNLVEAAGNWSDRIFSNEEIDLLARVRAAGGRVRLTPLPIAVHHAGRRLSGIDKFLAAFALKADTRRAWGFGQMVRLRFETRELAPLIRHFPEPFLAWLGTAFLLVATFYRRPFYWGAGFVCLTAVAVRRNLRYVLVAQGLIVHLVRGWTRLPPRGPAVSSVTRMRQCNEGI